MSPVFTLVMLITVYVSQKQWYFDIFR